jgi:hypothetical protein
VLDEVSKKDDILERIEQLKEEGYLPKDAQYVCQYKDNLRECYQVVIEAHEFVQIAPAGHKEPVYQWHQGLLPASISMDIPLYL